MNQYRKKIIALVIGLLALGSSLVEANGRRRYWIRMKGGPGSVCRNIKNPQERMKCIQNKRQQMQQRRVCLKNCMSQCGGMQVVEVPAIQVEQTSTTPQPSAPPLIEEEEGEVLELEEVEQ